MSSAAVVIGTLRVRILKFKQADPIYNKNVKTTPVTGTGKLTSQRLAHHIKNFNLKLFADANANANAGGSTIALPGLRPGEVMKAEPTVWAVNCPPLKNSR